MFFCALTLLPGSMNIKAIMHASSQPFCFIVDRFRLKFDSTRYKNHLGYPWKCSRAYSLLKNTDARQKSPFPNKNLSYLQTMIKVQNISKSFGEIKALNNISFHITEGDVFGLLGPNGAGKSTTINILSTLLQEDSGEIIVNGLNLRENKDVCKLMIGVVPQEIALYRDLSAYDNLLFWGGLYKIPKASLKAKANEVLALVGLGDRKNEPLKNYSGGMKRRVNIAASILHQPKILLMDEPTVGIDPQSRSYIFEIIQQLNDNGMTIIYTTHYMEEAERMCDKIAIIDSGSIKAIGSMEELRKASATNDTLQIKVSHIDPSVIDHLHLSLRVKADYESRVLEIECENISREITGVLKSIQDTGVIIESIDTQRANLESVFLKLTGKHLRD